MVVENQPYHQQQQHHQFYRKNLHIHHHQQQQHQRSTTFLPMLCSRPSIKDVSLPICRDRTSSSSSCDDPLSPRIGCMGQVKKKRNNKIAGFPTVSSHRLSFTSKSSSSTTTSSSYSSSPAVKYSKLKNLFYGKNFSTPTTTTSAASSAAVTTISSCGTRHQRMTLIRSSDRLRKERCCKSENLNCSISIDEMDPPLPVIKKVQKVEEGSLWKRRSGRPALKSLQIKQIQHPRICLQPTSV